MQDETTLDFRSFFQIIRRRMKLISCIIGILIIISVIFNFLITKPIYEAKTSIIIGKEINQQDSTYHYDDVIMYQKLVKTYAAIAKSNDVIKKSVYRLDSNITPEQLRKATKIVPQIDTQILDIKIQSKNAVNAKNMVDALTVSFMEVAEKVYPSSNIQIMNKAEVPKVPVKPNKMLNIIITFFLGVMISIIVVFILEHMDNTIKTEKSIENYLGISTIGVIPKYDIKPKHQNEKTIIFQKYPKSPVSEAYRILRTNLLYSSVDRQIKTTLVTSPVASEGKSNIVSNLAVTMVQDGKKVLIMDCDLRKPNIHKIFNIPNEMGLTNFLVDEITLSKALVRYSYSIYILTSGNIPPNPSEMLSSKKMKGLLEFFKDKFDYIIIDSPPINTFTDAQILSTMVDGVLFVVASGESMNEECIRAKELLLKVQANILGVILNKVEYKLGKRYEDYSRYPKIKEKITKKIKVQWGRRGRKNNRI